ncbi:MAG: lipopolysaccharide transport periplasmic protein LptA [Rhodobacteraceae bacterium]|nr:lipopolysaccharide transport periplasmic protein LptA [Paracoccaceae bacterium]
MKTWVFATFFSLFAITALAQGAAVPFGALSSGEARQVEITAVSLSIDQATQNAVFEGNVVAGMDTLRLTADRIEVVYSEEGGAGAVKALRASGNVVFVSGTDSAQADSATYELVEGNVLMEGNVILTQGQNALSGQRLRIDISTGTARMEGGVQAIFQTGGN